jgi:two-component system phosphate regulon sensor histidine kinase PhoR
MLLAIGIPVAISAIVVVVYAFRSTGNDAGVFPVLLLMLAAVVSGAIIQQSVLRRRVIAPLASIEEVTDHLAKGAVSSRITVDTQASAEVRAVASAINRLADRSAADVADMQRLERVRSEFIANVSHELRTPIFSVQGYLETLLDGAADDPEVSKQFLEKAYLNALRLNTLLSDLIDLSRIESGEMRMSFRYFNIVDLLQDLLHTVEIRATQRGVTLHLEDETQAVMVYGDRERLSQVLTNLIDNAIKYNVQGGAVTVRARRLNGDAEIVVTDTGIGIPQEHLQRIFERFYRVDKDRSRLVGGTGLGLAIVKHILEAHHTSATLASAPGKGTTIRFTLKAG